MKSVEKHHQQAQKHAIDERECILFENTHNINN